MRLLESILALALAASSPLSPLHADDGKEAELKRLEGRFERAFTNAAGTMFRTVKDVADGRSVVTTFDDVGNVVEAHESEYKIERHGPLWVFSFFNVVVTAGPGKGHRQFATNSFVYRLEGDSIIEAWGLLENDPNPPRMLLWKRVPAP